MKIKTASLRVLRASISYARPSDAIRPSDVTRGVTAAAASAKSLEFIYTTPVALMRTASTNK
ncbi:hypothetical protein BCR33DRAFT_50336 [Rhizoclosmatium globosum]|uniref:Uncharacterized protein n=1 Tax=Rhizoclosmatium globosum TaxID=329046 RepID=A0A1Y2AWZ2_9FUNG|nr:hypothetical protein BCR33DRAFT_50336 [Rhizoclosmatium globosum]|eukprot:ORY26425.1 hypothetical protein BCR33DRAFT_50336 [Rhizoclosmatium globosum]